MSLEPAAPTLPAQPRSGKTEYDHGLLRIRENTLVIDNAIYPIANISGITFSDLRTPVPRTVWASLVLGLACLPMDGGARFAGCLLLVIAGYLYVLHVNARSDADFALSVRLNGGNTAVVVSNDEDFLKAIALELYEVIELEKASNTTFNIDQKVMIDNITRSTVRITGLEGDIVDNVPGV